MRIGRRVFCVAVLACCAAPLTSARVFDAVVPSDTAAEASGPAGAAVAYTTDLTCDPASGSTFPLGPTTVNCTDAGGIPAGSFTVTVVDTTPPTLQNVPGDISVNATGPSTAVSFPSTPSATDLVDGAVAPACSASSGDVFPVGATVVNCTATDSSGNTSPPQSFTITVVDNQAPTITSAPSGTITKEATAAAGAVVNYAVAATDNVDSSPGVSCDHPSGAMFAIASTHVTCSASDAAGNTSPSVGFDVTVRDTTPPSFASFPSNQNLEAQGPSGAAFNYTVTATDSAGGASTNCSPASGSTFPLGATGVSCTATDSHGNARGPTTLFTITVADTTGPAFSNLPTGVQREADSSVGSAVSYSKPVANDLVDGLIPAVNCTPPSGTTFGLGTSNVTCHASDSHGHDSQVTFQVKVVDTTPPVLSVPGETTVYTYDTAGAHADSFLHSAGASDIADPHPSVNNDAPSIFPPGATTVNFTASDASGNQAFGSSRLIVVVLAPGKPIPSVPAAADRIPPDDVSGLTATGGPGTVRLVWTRPKAPDFDHVVITRSTIEPGSGGQAVYQGSATSFVDKSAQNGVEYRYVVVSYDKAGNHSAGVAAVATPRAALLLRPAEGARLRNPPKLTWRAVTGADYYNAQIYLGGAKVLSTSAAAGDVKVLSAWPKRPVLQLKKRWTYDRKTFVLRPGVYHWYVWPGFGDPRARKYGELLGTRTFVIVR